MINTKTTNPKDVEEKDASKSKKSKVDDSDRSGFEVD